MHFEICIWKFSDNTFCKDQLYLRIPTKLYNIFFIPL